MQASFRQQVDASWGRSVSYKCYSSTLEAQCRLQASSPFSIRELPCPDDQDFDPTTDEPPFMKLQLMPLPLGCREGHCTRNHEDVHCPQRWRCGARGLGNRD
ncbi:unnamed protein product [Pleuronectes platessa]|uniref:Uncharacterized protein n=1 Tax=Pleuronectes platessa TaxID=8262 RepID=A0A9N7VX77_PLEPL|nr:unnamed protein product [Pleuronectes platessa]